MPNLLDTAGGQAKKKFKVKKKKAPEVKGPPTPVNKSTAFSPKVQAPFAKAQRQAKKRTVIATKPVPQVLPSVPAFKNPTPKQSATTNRLYVKSRKRALGGTPSEVGAKRTAEYETELRTGNQRKLRRIIKLTNRSGSTPGPDASKMLGTDARHRHIKVPFASIDTTPLIGAVGDSTSFVAKKIKDVESSLDTAGTRKGVIGVVGRATNDLIDLPANTVTGAYYTAKQLKEEGPLAVGEDIVKSTVHTLKHPLDHPLYTVLTLSGGKAVVGRQGGAVARSGALGKTAKRVASVEGRAPKVVAGSRTHVPGSDKYSRDVVTKGGQVVRDKVARRRRVRKGKPAERRATDRDINRMVDETEQAAKTVTRQNQGRVAKEGQEALAPRRGPKVRVVGNRARGRRERPTSAVSTTAQGITDATSRDLAAYLDEVRAAAPKLIKKSEIEANARTQSLLEDAIRDHDPVKVKRAAEAYNAISARLDREKVRLGIVDSVKAEQTKLESVRARRVKRGSNPATGKDRRLANRAVKDAKLEKDLADAEFKSEKAKVQHKGQTLDKIPVAVVARRDAAHAAFDAAKQKAQAAQAVHVRAHIPADGVDPSYISQQPLQSRSAAIPLGVPEPGMSKTRKGEAVRSGTLDTSPTKMVEQLVESQRLIDSTKARGKLIDDMGYRAKDGALRTFKTENGAQKFAGERLKDRTSMDWVPVRKAKGEVVLLPKVAADRIKAHGDIAEAQPRMLRRAGGQWRKNVLGFSPRWLAGQAIEGAFRSVVAGAGPVSYYTGRQTLKGLERADPDLAAEFSARAKGQGMLESADSVLNDKSLIRQSENLGKMAQAIHTLWNAPGPKHLSKLYGAYTHFVFDTVNGNIESPIRTAMLGRALRSHPLMGKHVVGLAERAAKEAADGKFDTPTMAELGRAVDDMYGRYDKFSPEIQGAIANYTPFLSWAGNATNFLFHVMPRDHPILTALAAQQQVVSEEWRKKNGYFLDFTGKTDGQLPGYMMGSIPGKGDSYLNVGRYLPMGLMAADGVPVFAQAQGLLLPQLQSILKNVNGNDWKDKPLSENPSGARDALAVAASLFESQVPAASLAVRLSGAKLPNVSDQDKAKGSEPVGERVQATLLPFEYSGKKKVRVKASTAAPTSSYGSGGYGSSSYGSSSYGSSGYGSGSYGGG